MSLPRPSLEVVEAGSGPATPLHARLLERRPTGRGTFTAGLGRAGIVTVVTTPFVIDAETRFPGSVALAPRSVRLPCCSPGRSPAEPVEAWSASWGSGP